MKFKNLILMLVISLTLVGCGKEASSIEMQPNPDKSFIDYLLLSDVGHKTLEEIGPISENLNFDFTLEDIYNNTKVYLTEHGLDPDEAYEEKALLASSSFEEFVKTADGDSTVDSEDTRSYSSLMSRDAKGERTPYSTSVELINLQTEDRPFIDIIEAGDYIPTINTENLGIVYSEDTDSEFSDHSDMSILKQMIEKLGLPTKIIFYSSEDDELEKLLDGSSWYASHGFYSDYDMKTSMYTLKYEFEDFDLNINLHELTTTYPESANAIEDQSNGIGYGIDRVDKSLVDYYSSQETKLIGEVNGIQIMEFVKAEDE